MDGITVAYTMINPGDADMGDEWDASVAYSAGALSAKYSIDEADVTKLTATYDLGGASVFFANRQQLTTISKQLVSTSRSNHLISA